MASTKFRILPLYRQASEGILQRLQANEWQEGEALPNEFELAAQHEVSQGTMRKALDLLVEEGILLRRQGAGTFVATRQDFIGEARAARLGDPSVQDKIRFEFVGITRLHASAQVAEELALRRHTPLWQITRLLRVNASLFAVDLAFLPEFLFPSLNAKRLQQWNANLKQMCLIDFGVHVVERKVRYRAVFPNQEISRLLQLTQDMPLLERIRVVQNRENTPVIWGMTTFKTDEFAFCPNLPHIA
jgi:GntR family transcriptional regulator